MRGLRRAVVLVVRWYATATGVLYALLVVGAVVSSMFSARWGLLVTIAMVAIAIPYKLARLEASQRTSAIAFQRRDNEFAVLRTQVADMGGVAGRVAALEKQVADMGGAVGSVDSQAQERANQSRSDALAAVDTARHEWSELLSAERRLTEANIRSEVNRQVAVSLSSIGDERSDLGAPDPSPNSRT